MILLAAALVALTAVMVAAGVLLERKVVLPGRAPAPASAETAGFKTDRVTWANPPRALPPLQVTDTAGRPAPLAELKGKVVVANLWATWCAPCIKEMPTLARLQQAYAGRPVAVVPISLDSEKDLAKAKAFIAKHPPLEFRRAPLNAAFEMQPPAPGLPTTLILDRQGRERARLPAEADWSSPAARKLIDRILAEG
jgi:thiol-disulfide isomerase/thioredoxin